MGDGKTDGGEIGDVDGETNGGGEKLLLHPVKTSPEEEEEVCRDDGSPSVTLTSPFATDA